MVQTTDITRLLPMTPAWMDRQVELDPRRVMFAHDSSVWEPA